MNETSDMNLFIEFVKRQESTRMSNPIYSWDKPRSAVEAAEEAQRTYENMMKSLRDGKPLLASAAAHHLSKSLREVAFCLRETSKISNDEED
jgi:hypothetical protein